ncbi:MAG: AMP-binding protein [Nocardioidaceae bacterium]
MTADASLRPLAGPPRAIESAVQRWLEVDDPPALTVRTSGSTGQPKDVLLSAAALRASAAATLARIGGPGQWVLALPAHYVAGLQVLIRSALAGLAPVHLDEHADLTAATTALTGKRRYLAAVPTQLYRWLESDAAALTAYDVVLLGGGPAPEHLLRLAHHHDVTVVTTYGMSETCGGCVYDGVPLDGVGVALGRGGEIRLSGPVLFDGYDGRPDLTAMALRDGWFHTADRGRLDDDGRLVVLGRTDDVVITGGVNVSVGTVEARLNLMPGMEQAAVVAGPDDEWGVEIVAVVQRGASIPSLAEIRDFVGAAHPRHWAPRRLVLVDDLPMLASGKVDRRRLAELIAEPR